MEIGAKYDDLGEDEISPEVPQGGLNLDAMYVRQVFFGMGRYFQLTPTEALLLATIHSLSKDGRTWCYMSQQHLADALNLTLPTINALLEKLRVAELLEKGVRHPRWKSYQWKLAPKALDRLSFIRAQIAKGKAAKGM